MVSSGSSGGRLTTTIGVGKAIENNIETEPHLETHRHISSSLPFSFPCVSIQAIRRIVSIPYHLYRSAVAHCSQSIMEETCIRFGQHGARIMIEDKEIPHYAIHVDPVKKEVSCWIASEAGKVCGSLFLFFDNFVSTNIGLFSYMVRTRRRLPNFGYPTS